MYPNTVKVETSKGELVVYDLSVGHIASVESGETPDTITNIVLDSTNLTIEELSSYRKGDLDIIADASLKLTYPEAYNEDGSLREIDKLTDDVDKKKP